MMNSFATAISIALQYGVPLETLVQKFSYMRFEPEGITANPEIPFAKSMPDYIMRWLASRFLDTDAQEELGILTPAVRARKAAQEAAQSVISSDTAGPEQTMTSRPRTPPRLGRTATAARAPRRPRSPTRPRSSRRELQGLDLGPGVQPVRRHDAAHRLLLHVLELRQQHRLRLKRDSRRICCVLGRSRAEHASLPASLICLAIALQGRSAMTELTA